MGWEGTAVSLLWRDASETDRLGRKGVSVNGGGVRVGGVGGGASR